MRYRLLESAPKDKRLFAIAYGKRTVIGWSNRWERWTDLVESGMTYSHNDPNVMWMEEGS